MKRICVIGCGVIGSLFARYLAKENTVYVHNTHPEKAERLAEHDSIHMVRNLKQEIELCDLIVLAVKPQNLAAVSKEISAFISSHQILASALVGITSETLGQYFNQAKILRMMPNIAIECGEGVLGLALSEEYTSEQREALSALFSGLGLVKWIPEEKMDALSALAGSGTAFVMVFLEALAESGIAMGLHSSLALELASQTVSGAIALLKESKRFPGELKWDVCSPGGTTIAGVQVMEEAGVRAGTTKAVLTTYKTIPNVSE